MTKIIQLLVLALCFTSCQSMKKMTTDVTDKKVVQIRTTAYTLDEKDHKKYKNKDACGKVLKAESSIATSWDQFPVDTKLKIGGNIYTVTDYGKFILKAGKYPVPTVDVYQPSKSDMREWGVRYFDDVEIVQMGSYEKSLEILKDRLRYKQCRVMYEKILEKI
jgi:3D (Asp-Asp-Asp) domain-containing protein